MAAKAITLILFLLFTTLCSFHAFPLSSKSRWIVDDSTGKRVKLAGINWPGHMEVMLPEGLHRQPLSHIARQISLMGFNIVRLTYAVYMYTRYSNVTVAQRFNDLGLHSALEGITKHNPQLLNLTLVDARKAVIDELGAHGVMVLLDNQVSKPFWCCDNHDGNGFFGDEYFDPIEWMHSLAIAAKSYKQTPNVVAMSLRNELRGPRQNWDSWYTYIEKGAKTIHQQNPNVLVLISGLYYDLDLSSLKQRPLNLDFKNKLVYELHRYTFSDDETNLWLNEPLNVMCENVTQQIEDRGGFLFKGENASPLFFTEWGVDQTEGTLSNNLFRSCFFSYLGENDLDWALWALAGDYYLRQGKQDMEDIYGLLDPDWSTIRNPDFVSKLQILQGKLQDPDSNKSSLIMYHPYSGRSLQVHNIVIHATNFLGLNQWSHEGELTPITVMGSDLCLTATGDGLPVALTTDCDSERSIWGQYSEYQISNKDDEGNFLCLEYDPYYSPMIVTKKCVELDNHLNAQMQNQWFKLITTNLI